jgi:hypothetical protein
MQTPNLGLPFLAAGQAQKHVTLNDGLTILDDLVQLSVESSNLMTPPAAPPSGARYLVDASPSGLWSQQANAIATWKDGGWSYHTPRVGWSAYVRDVAQTLIFNGVEWATSSMIGINATPDSTNRLSVSSEATLFNHAGDSHRMKLNKAISSGTASLLFQTGFSGRAEIGTTGSDALAFKVSPDGASWHDALTIDPETALVSFPANPGATARPNLLVNGDFAINQRAFTGGPLANGSFGYDRWAATGASGANLQYTNGVVTLLSGKIMQKTEPELWSLPGFAGQTMTVSLENPSANISVELETQTGTISAGSGRKAVSLVVPANHSGPLSLRLGVSQSTTFSRVKLEAGPGATPWSPRNRICEEQLCQRYYYRLSGNIWVFLSNGAAGSYMFSQISLPVSMRVTPLVSRNISLSANLLGGDPANAPINPVGKNLLQLSVRSQSAGECYALFDLIECTAEV